NTIFACFALVKFVHEDYRAKLWEKSEAQWREKNREWADRQGIRASGSEKIGHSGSGAVWMSCSRRLPRRRGARLPRKSSTGSKSPFLTRGKTPTCSAPTSVRTSFERFGPP